MEKRPSVALHICSDNCFISRGLIITVCPSDSPEFRGDCGARGLGECFFGKDILGLPGREVLGQRCLQKDPNEAQ